MFPITGVTLIASGQSDACHAPPRSVMSIGIVQCRNHELIREILLAKNVASSMLGQTSGRIVGELVSSVSSSDRPQTRRRDRNVGWGGRADAVAAQPRSTLRAVARRRRGTCRGGDRHKVDARRGGSTVASPSRRGTALDQGNWRDRAQEGECRPRMTGGRGHTMPSPRKVGSLIC